MGLGERDTGIEMPPFLPQLEFARLVAAILADFKQRHDNDPDWQRMGAGFAGQAVLDARRQRGAGQDWRGNEQGRTRQCRDIRQKAHETSLITNQLWKAPTVRRLP